MRLEGAAVEGLGLAITPGGPIEKREVVEAGEGVGMLRAEHALARLEGAAVEGLGLAITPGGPIELLTLVRVSGCSGPSTRSRASRARR